ncbi:MAG: U32 family peptidase [Bacteroidales bacterium]|nr:U32 family peptidase [Bacteroidales bacterium]
MRQLELLAPARDIQVGIAAIDCGADAVYIAGPQFGARQAAGNTVDDIRQLCSYAHRFGARIFVALNTILYDDELEAAYRQMLQVQEAGADALIIQDLSIIEMARSGIGNLREDFHIPLHASTQCAIRTPEQAVFLESLGFSRLILERELSLEQIRAIRKAVTCELEFFVHGALCVCYSGQCYLSERIAGRSANRGACIQACRSRYDLADASGRILVKDKALLSLKDYNLKARIEELADAGISSFKIEGRLKNASYVRNVVRDYSMALDRIVEKRADEYERGSFGSVTGGFVPDTSKTFNRGYTELYIDGKRGKWAAMDAAKSMGEEIGEITSLNRERSAMTIRPARKGISLNNGDGFSFVAKDGNVVGFRGDVCEGQSIRCKAVPEAFVGARLYRNMNVAFERELERQACTRSIDVMVDVSFTSADGSSHLKAVALSEDGRSVEAVSGTSGQAADNRIRMTEMIRSQIGKAALHYRFHVRNIDDAGDIPFMSASALNAVRRELAEMLEQIPCMKKDILLRKPEGMEAWKRFPQKNATYKNNISNLLSEKVHLACGAAAASPAYELSHIHDAELMRSKYCIRFELGMCPKHHGCKDSGPLFLLNNGRSFSLSFDCRNCEMVLKESDSPQSRK